MASIIATIVEQYHLPEFSSCTEVSQGGQKHLVEDVFYEIRHSSCAGVSHR